MAEQQAGRLSQVCRPFAPVYRQLTLRAIGGQITAAAAQRAYGDVRSAWLDYLGNHNKGRGVLLIGHSQVLCTNPAAPAEAPDGSSPISPQLRSQGPSAR